MLKTKESFVLDMLDRSVPREKDEQASVLKAHSEIFCSRLEGERICHACIIL